MSAVGEETVSIESGAVRLEARLSLPDGAQGAAVVCHPHPQYGGDMDNSVVTALVSALDAERWATLRFNFRGVGASTGAFGDMVGEAEDVAAALAFLAERCPRSRLVLAGYSFGALIALDVGLKRSDVAAVVAVAPPFGMLPPPTAPAEKPLVLLVGDSDQFCPLDAFESAARSLGPKAGSEVVAGADHFFFGAERTVAARAVALLNHAG